MEDKIIIGRSEYIDLPDLGLYHIPAKIDTGAYHSSLHCHDIRLDDKRHVLYFKLLDPSHPEYDTKEQQTSVFSLVRVRNVATDWSSRYKIKTTITLAGRTFPVSLTIVDRRDMRFPVLIGRQALKKKFLVNVAK